MKNVKKGMAVFFSVVLAIGSSTAMVSCGKKELKSVSLNGVDLKNYIVVYDDEDIFAKYCAQNLSLLIQDIVSYDMNVVSDEQTASEYEILIGDTNRAESASAQAVALEKDEYILHSENKKLVMRGNGYMVGGAANHLINKLILPAQKGDAAKASCEANLTPFTYRFETPKNAILMIGDGMGDNHIESALASGATTEFWATSFPYRGAATTYSYSVYKGFQDYTDSAAAATALATGYKTFNNFVGCDYEGNDRKNIRELAYEKGAKTAILTTDNLTGATPAGFLAHGVSRTDTESIRNQINALSEENKVTVAEGSVGPYLTEITATALSTISENGSKFFAMIEEGWIDKHSHNRSFEEMFVSLNRFNDVIAYVMEFVLMHPDTVLIVTADHETGGIVETDSGEYKFTSTNHTNADVSVFAMGATAERFNGVTVDNIDIAKYIAGIYGDANFGGSSLR